jgi:hypothetical protein
MRADARITIDLETEDVEAKYARPTGGQGPVDQAPQDTAVVVAAGPFPRPGDRWPCVYHAGIYRKDPLWRLR